MKTFSSSRSAVILFLTLGILLIPTAAFGQTDDLNCDDISRAEAQAILDADPSDPNDLDRDNDGEACDDDDSGDAETGTARVPSRVETGGGGTAAGSGNDGATVVAVVALAGLAAGAVVVRSRTS